MPEQIKPNPKPKFEIRNDRFDEYCGTYFQNLSEEQKKLLPFEIVKNLHLPHKLNFAQKLYIASVAFETEVFIVVPPLGKNDSAPENTVDWLLNCDETISDSEKMLDTIGFVLSSKDVVSVYAKASRMTTGPAVRYILKSRTKTKSKKKDSDVFNDNTAFVGNMILNFCCIAKKMVSELDISMAEFFALVYLLDGKEKHIYPLQQQTQFAFGGSKRSISTAFPKLKHKGLASRTHHKLRRYVKYRITTKGLAVFNDLVSNYITNF